MDEDEIERALRTVEPIEPSADFVERVMGAVRRAEDAPPPLAFPWRRLAAGTCALFACGVLAAAALAWSSSAQGPSAVDLARLAGLGVAQAIAWTLLALAG